ncbi:MAG: fatty acyl-AMP ligase [Oscillatoria sp. PMC 1068.18]|nr:fatty acyl-AMP ligase [Oscillatoria sp. PMC 1076.18]MEC4990330.1 fatty acyl-AMP ligase [Oscillatoria sp. PMC 1068.18]
MIIQQPKLTRVTNRKNSQLTTIVDILENHAKTQPEKLAYLFLEKGEREGESLTYQKLWEKAQIIASHLQDYPQERALLLYPSGLEFITAFFGCLLAGVVAVPVYPPRQNQKLSRLLSIIDNAEATLALTTENLYPNLQERWEGDRAKLNWLATDSSSLSLKAGNLPKITPERIAFLQYTSGSTGKPKGVMVNHRNLIDNETAIAQAFGHNQNTIVVGWLPLFHDMGLIGNVLQPLYLGIPSILMSPLSFLQKPIRWLQAISKYRATTSGGPNFAYDFCVEKTKPEQLENLDLSSWEVAYNGSEPLRANTLAQFSSKFASCGFRKNSFYPCYGMAENTLFTTGGTKDTQPIIKAFEPTALEQNQAVELPVSDSSSRLLVSCGHTWLDHQVVIANPHTFTRCREGEVGEIWVSGASVAQGYWQRDDGTFHATLKDTGESSFLQTGDLGFLWQGELFLTGRLKEVIIIRGQNHYPQDIEFTVQQSHSALRLNGGAAFTVEMDSVEKLIVVQEVQRNSLKTVDLDQLKTIIQKTVTAQHGLSIDKIFLVKSGTIPKTSSGKIQRRNCRQNFLEGLITPLALSHL